MISNRTKLVRWPMQKRSLFCPCCFFIREKITYGKFDDGHEVVCTMCGQQHIVRRDK